LNSIRSAGWFRDLEATLISLIGPRHRGADGLVHPPTDQLAGVALHAAEVSEHAEPLDLLERQRRGVAVEEAVPPARRDQGGLEGSDRLDGVLEVDRVGMVRKGGREPWRVAGDVAQHPRDLSGLSHRHLLVSEQRPPGLRDQVWGSTVPELRGLANRVVDRRAVAPPAPTSHPDGHRLAVDATLAQHVTRAARHRAVARQSRIEEQLLPEPDGVVGVLGPLERLEAPEQARIDPRGGRRFGRMRIELELWFAGGGVATRCHHTQQEDEAHTGRIDRQLSA
jgi:hypothetical protein